ncbi:MAG: hypothetical protein IPP81_07305 [Chitinophagaceae bacterium]|nr:hypothetical protein [Chitinophagaceae bacterium]
MGKRINLRQMGPDGVGNTCARWGGPKTNLRQMGAKNKLAPDGKNILAPDGPKTNLRQMGGAKTNLRQMGDAKHTCASKGKTNLRQMGGCRPDGNTNKGKIQIFQKPKMIISYHLHLVKYKGWD